MFEHRYGIKLKKTTADATALKLLRQCFPTQSFSELRAKIQANDYVFLSDMEKYQHDGVRQMAKLLREFDKAGIETELFEESRYTPNPWRAEPMSREYLKNILQRDREITRQVLEDIERETVGYIVQMPRKTLIKKYLKFRNSTRMIPQVSENMYGIFY